MSERTRIETENKHIEIFRNEGIISYLPSGTVFNESRLVLHLPNGTAIHIDFSDNKYSTGNVGQEASISIFRMKDTELTIFDDKVSKKLGKDGHTEIKRVEWECASITNIIKFTKI